MQIILEENEIMEALNGYCAKQITVPEGKKLKVTFTVGRGDNGTRATIEFEAAEAVQSSAEDPATPGKKKKIRKDEETYETTSEEPSALFENPNKKTPDTLEEIPKDELEPSDAAPAGNSLFKY